MRNESQKENEESKDNRVSGDNRNMKRSKLFLNNNKLFYI